MNRRRWQLFIRTLVPAFLLVLLANCRERKTFPAVSTPVSPAGNTVEVRRSGNGYQLFRNGEPYYIKGTSGRQNLEMIREAGGNSVRTYSTEGLDTLLDQAAQLGLTVMAGIWIGREIEGFDYRDERSVRLQKEWVATIVNQYKDHPALLCWAIGNEPEYFGKNKAELWKAINDLVRLVHKIDPSHPVTVPVIAYSADEFIQHCPDVDFLSINVFGHIFEFSENYAHDIPYVYTEWGVLGSWESQKTSWGASIEESIRQKYERIHDIYRQVILPDSTHCMGSYIFYWGHKQEYTSTWFSFFTENGSKTALVDLMSLLWSGRYPVDWAPLLDSLRIDYGERLLPGFLPGGEICTARVTGIDPELAPLHYRWEILPEGPFVKYTEGKGRMEVRTDPLPDLFIKKEGPSAVFKTPDHTGPFRLVVHAFDPQGNAAYANIPFFVNDIRLTQ